MKNKILLFITLFLSYQVFANALPSTLHSTPDDIVGIWKNGSGKGHIQIFKNGNKYYGKITWLTKSTDENGNPKVDRKNANESLRDRPLIGLTMLKDFVYDDGAYSGGRIYNPSDGKEYKAYLKLDDPNNLTVRGYVGISLFGKTDNWIRVK